ncbi:pilin [Psychrobacter aquimaris]|uniref:pilin n=1 Tax=Psychrobacter aquimaris TaxID=292733 RepID=UPI0018E02605|nr:pilin [Psychrobacter aquimaris]
MKPYLPAVQNCHLRRRIATQSGYTLIELMIAVAIIGILAVTATVSYQTQVRKTQVMTVYQEINHFRLPYQILMDDGAGVTDFSPSGLNMPAQTKYCQFTVTAPIVGNTTPNAIICNIQNLSYIQGQSLSLDRAADGSWQCRPSAGIPKAYLPKECQ